MLLFITNVNALQFQCGTNSNAYCAIKNIDADVKQMHHSYVRTKNSMFMYFCLFYKSYRH